MKAGLFCISLVVHMLTFSVPSSADPAVRSTVAGEVGPALTQGAAEEIHGSDGPKPDVATLLFGTPQWSEAPPGAKLSYTFDKVAADAAFGQSFKDTVVLTISAGDNEQSRTTEMQLFSGANRKPAGPFRSDGQNPVLLVILENNVQELAKLFKANPRYLKNAIRKAWRDHAKIGPAQDMIDGKTVSVTRIAVEPFLGDPEADKMQGLQTMTYIVDIANDIPGTITAIDIRAPSQGKPLFAETLRYASEVRP